MLKGFDSKNVSDSSDATMVFFSEFLCYRKSGLYGISSKLLGAVLVVCFIAATAFMCDYDFEQSVFFYILSAFSFVILVMNFFAISRIAKISFIEDINHCRVIKNRKGKYGLCAQGLIRRKSIRILKRMKYDEIVIVSDCSYIFRKKDKYGIYNSSMKKFIVPLECDYIAAAPDGNALVVIKDDETMRYSFEGFRSFKKKASEC